MSTPELACPTLASLIAFASPHLPSQCSIRSSRAHGSPAPRERLKRSSRGAAAYAAFFFVFGGRSWYRNASPVRAMCQMVTANRLAIAIRALCFLIRRRSFV